MSPCTDLEKLRRVLIAFEHLEPGLESRFWSQVRLTDDCWFWAGAISSRGYGKFQWRDVQGAHRVAYTLAIDPVPEGHYVMHKCDNRACVRPDHLVVGTAQENNLDRQAKGRSKGPAPKTHCPLGHPYDEANTAYNAQGYKVCRLCRSIRKSRYRVRGRSGR